MNQNRRFTLQTGFISSIFAIIFFILRDKIPDEEIKAPIKEYKFVNLNTKTINEILNGSWILLITNKPNNKQWINEAVRKSNIAVLKVNSFEQSKLATLFNITQLPDVIFINNGKLKDGSVINGEMDFWKALDIYILVKYYEMIKFFGRKSIVLISESVDVLGIIFQILPFFRPYVFVF